MEHYPLNDLIFYPMDDFGKTEMETFSFDKKVLDSADEIIFSVSCGDSSPSGWLLQISVKQFGVDYQLTEQCTHHILDSSDSNSMHNFCTDYEDDDVDDLLSDIDDFDDFDIILNPLRKVAYGLMNMVINGCESLLVGAWSNYNVLVKSVLGDVQTPEFTTDNEGSYYAIGQMFLDLLPGRPRLDSFIEHVNEIYKDYKTIS